MSGLSAVARARAVATLRFEGANADSAHDAALARRLGAGGVGLSRSEHWFSGEHSAMITELFTGETPGDSAPSLDRFADRTRAVTKSLFAELAGAPLTVRLLDAPPEEFGLAAKGRRGVQLARVRSDLYRTQLRALVEAAGDAPSAREVPRLRVLDVDGIGRLLEMVVAGARSATAPLEVGVCGEVAGDPASIGWLVNAGVPSLSVSHYRVPAARLAVAQALLRSDAGDATSPLGAG